MRAVTIYTSAPGMGVKLPYIDLLHVKLVLSLYYMHLPFGRLVPVLPGVRRDRADHVVQRVQVVQANHAHLQHRVVLGFLADLFMIIQ